MSCFNAHRRKVITSVTLGCWLFAFFIGVVHACGQEVALDHARHGGSSVMASTDSQSHDDRDVAPYCEQFCIDDTPVLTSPQSGQDQPQSHAHPPPSTGDPLWVRVFSVPPPLYRPHPPPGIALITLFGRLAL